VTTEKKPLESVRRALRIVWTLQGHSFDGLRLTAIADSMKVAKPTVFRDLETLADEGMVERIPGKEDCWRLTPKLIQLARAHDQEMTALRRRVEEMDNRYTRAPK